MASWDFSGEYWEEVGGDSGEGDVWDHGVWRVELFNCALLSVINSNAALHKRKRKYEIIFGSQNGPELGAGAKLVPRWHSWDVRAPGDAFASRPA
jgi:hypothetical protein